MGAVVVGGRLGVFLFGIVFVRLDCQGVALRTEEVTECEECGESHQPKRESPDAQWKPRMVDGSRAADVDFTGGIRDCNTHHGPQRRPRNAQLATAKTVWDRRCSRCCASASDGANGGERHAQSVLVHFAVAEQHAVDEQTGCGQDGVLYRETPPFIAG